MTREQSAKVVCVSVQTLARWQKEYGGLRINQARKVKDLERENIRLKKFLANFELDKSILKEDLTGNY